MRARASQRLRACIQARTATRCRNHSSVPASCRYRCLCPSQTQRVTLRTAHLWIVGCDSFSRTSSGAETNSYEWKHSRIAPPRWFAAPHAPIERALVLPKHEISRMSLKTNPLRNAIVIALAASCTTPPSHRAPAIPRPTSTASKSPARASARPVSKPHSRWSRSTAPRSRRRATSTSLTSCRTFRRRCAEHEPRLVADLLARLRRHVRQPAQPGPGTQPGAHRRPPHGHQRGYPTWPRSRRPSSSAWKC